MQKLLFARIELWVLLVVVLLGSLGLIFFGGLVYEHTEGRHRAGFVGKAAVAVARMPLTVEEVLVGKDPMVVFNPDIFDGKSGWNWTEYPKDDGYWMMSWFDATRRRSEINLVRLSDGEIVKRWLPDYGAVLEKANQSSRIAEFANWNNGKFKIYGPVLRADGSVLIKSMYTPLWAIDGCGEEIWTQDDLMFHHSSESDGEGGWWIPTVIEPTKIEGVSPQFRDDGLTHVAADGTIIESISVAEILLRNDLDYLVFQVGDYDDDPLHLNDIQPVLQDGPYWKKGDLFLSLRHKSMVMLYRPSTDEIVWMQRGPWMGQHDVDILNDHTIQIFDNSSESRTNGVGKVRGASTILEYDFATGKVSSPLRAAMEREKVLALYEGLYNRLPNGDTVIEDHNSGRILFLGADGRKLGEFINRNPNGLIYEIGWGVYVEKATAEAAMAQWASQTCPAQ